MRTPHCTSGFPFLAKHRDRSWVKPASREVSSGNRPGVHSGSVVDLCGTVIDGVSIATANAAFTNHDGGDNVSVKHGDTTLPATIQRTGKRIVIALAAPVELAAGEMLTVIVI